MSLFYKLNLSSKCRIQHVVITKITVSQEYKLGALTNLKIPVLFMCIFCILYISYNIFGKIYDVCLFWRLAYFSKHHCFPVAFILLKKKSDFISFMAGSQNPPCVHTSISSPRHQLLTIWVDSLFWLLWIELIKMGWRKCFKWWFHFVWLNSWGGVGDGKVT